MLESKSKLNYDKFKKKYEKILPDQKISLDMIYQVRLAQPKQIYHYIYWQSMPCMCGNCLRCCIISIFISLIQKQ